MADLTEFEQLAKAHPPNKRPCPVPTERAALKGNNLAAFNEALARPKWDIASSIIARWCQEHGFEQVLHQNITAHRMRKCQCSRMNSDG